MNKKNIRLFSGCLLVLLCISALTGCGGSSSGTSTNSPGTNPSSGGPFTVRFDSKGGASVESQVVNGRLKLAKPDDPYTPDKPDFYFDGWYTSTSYSDKWDFDNDIVTSDLTLYARWKDATNDNIKYSYQNQYYIVSHKGLGNIEGDVYIPGYHKGDEGTFIVKKIADSGFLDEKNMDAIYLPASLDALGEAAFRGCTGLSRVELPDKVRAIPESAFNDCDSLEDIVIPPSVYCIAARAFRNTAISSINIFNKQTKYYTIVKTAFIGCEKLAEVNIYRTTPPQWINDDNYPSFSINDVFADCSTNLVIRVPKGSLDDYKNADGWGAYSEHIFEW